MAEAAKPELNPNDPFLFEECVTHVGTFAMTHGRPMVARQEAGEWRYYPTAGGESADAMVCLAEVDDTSAHEPQLRYVVAHSGTGTQKSGYLAELTWQVEVLPAEDVDAEWHMPTEDTLRFYADYRVVRERFIRDPTGARHLVRGEQLDDEQLATLRKELLTLRTI